MAATGAPQSSAGPVAAGGATAGGTVNLFDGAGDVRALGRMHDWASTPLGALERWSPTLRAAVRLVLDAPVAMCLHVGPEFVAIYNDAYHTVLGCRHPAALGAPAATLCAGAWLELQAHFAGIVAGGPAVELRNVQFVRVPLDGAVAADLTVHVALSAVREECADEAGCNVIAVLAHVSEAISLERAEVERLIVILESERQQMRALIELMPVPVAFHRSPDHRIEIVNGALSKISGGRDLTGLTPAEAYPEVVGQGILERYDEVLATGMPWISRETYARFDRRGQGLEDAWFDLRYEPVRTADGRIIGILNFSVDVTEQVVARLGVERLLRESEAARAQVLSTLESIADAFYALDANYCFTYVNRMAEQLWGGASDTLLGQCIWTAFPAGVGTEIHARMDEAMHERRPVHFEAKAQLLDRWVDVSFYPDDASGGLACYFRDVTQRQHAEAKLLESQERYLSLVNAIDQGFCTLEVQFDDAGTPVDYRFIEISPSFERQTGIVDGLGRWMRDIAPDQERHWYERYGRVATTGVPERCEANSTPLDRWWSVYAFRVGDPSLRHVGVLFHDISQRKHAEAERERLLQFTVAARAEAENANRAKGEFLTVMSHELRTPLNAIGGYTELMQLGIRGPVTKEQLGDLARIQHSQQHLLGLVNEVLNYAKLESGSVTFELRDVAVRESMLAAEALVSPQAHARGLTICVGECSSHLTVRADPEKLMQVLVNLLANAVKFTDAVHAGVLPARIDVWCEAEGAFGAYRVRDSGIGIPADKLASIFEPFTQVTSGLTRPHDGAGLGLAISRDLARGMGGDLTVTSQVGEGSIFTVTLPLGQDLETAV